MENFKVKEQKNHLNSASKLKLQSFVGTLKPQEQKLALMLLEKRYS